MPYPNRNEMKPDPAAPPQEPENPMEDKAEGGKEEGTPIDAIIGQVDSYIQDPKKVTPETLTDLKSQLEDLKSYLDSDSESGPEDHIGPPRDGGKPGLAIMIGRVAKKNGEDENA